MDLALAASLTLRPLATRRFLGAALGHAAPTADDVCAAGVPRYEAIDFVRRLRQAGEIGDAGWSASARDAYRRRLDDDAPPRLGSLTASERPREKALASGIGALSDAELVALLLRTGSAELGVLALAERLLTLHDGIVGLSSCDIAALADERGMGPAKAAELAGAFEIGRRLARARRRERPPLRCLKDVYAILAPDLVGLRHEELWCLPLDPHARLIGEPRVVSRGDVDGTDAGPRAFFRLALAAGATSVIAVHNHPSGDATPSHADRQITLRLATAGRLLDVALADHVIIGDDGRSTSLRAYEPGLFLAPPPGSTALRDG
ncbi:MAG TPA: DNA repair protein RadC [Planctomycetota bacterium]|nr:DNA repair protein RadC [Planctomycetota bacterium]